MMRHALLIGLMLVGLAAPHEPHEPYEPHEPFSEIFDALYNLDYPDALAGARADTAAAPNDPTSHRALAEVLWLQMLFLRGGATLEPYIG